MKLINNNVWLIEKLQLGYKTGLYDASALQQAAMGGAIQSQQPQMQSQPDVSYSEPVVEQGNGLGRL